MKDEGLKDKLHPSSFIPHPSSFFNVADRLLHIHAGAAFQEFAIPWLAFVFAVVDDHFSS